MAGVSWRNVALNEADPAASPGSMVADIPQLQAAGMLIVDQAATSGYTSPIHWDILPQGYWREVKEAATQNWKSVGEFVKTLLIVAAAQVPLPGPVVDPAALALQQQLAKQQQDHLLRWRLSDSRLTRKRLFTQRHWRRFGADPLFDIHPAKVLMPVHLCPELVAEDPDTLTAQFGFKVILEFYDFLMRLIGEDRASMEESKVQAAWQDFQLRQSRDGVEISAPNLYRWQRSPSHLRRCWHTTMGVPQGRESDVPQGTYYTVDNYAADEHWSSTDGEIRKERVAGNIVPMQEHRKLQRVSAVGVVAKERKGIVKYRPLWDYSRLVEFGVNSRIDLDTEKFSSIKDACALLRPELWMAKLDLTATYRSVPLAAIHAGLPAEARAAALQAACFAPNPQTAYSTGVRSYVSFCISGRARGFLERMLPAEDDVLALWVVYMVTEREVKLKTAKKYTSGVQALHLQLGFEWVLVRQRWAVHAALQGCSRSWDTTSKQTMPLGFAELLLIAEVVKPHSFNENVVFSASTLCFFTFFRKDNVSVEKAEAWRQRGYLVRSDVSLPDTVSADIRVWHSKTIQAGERYHHLHLLHVPDSPICPKTPLHRVEDVCMEDAKGKLKPLTHSIVVGTVRKLVERVGLDPASYIDHSFRRGGNSSFQVAVVSLGQGLGC
ncbi:hypothetical protein CYMTET_50742 [Cymbomonas tetramitiformis]|uniref:Uncharacterized protein n=1 Tax=Cymbomonas tetramitiformis TaxID=36881 RepID=A0AAE0BNS8_9CHLO|nr:hypothetical protein CYMTET_50742 [Cymbomonas tetramitiformis]